jgi:Sugar kinases, ribokinase family
MGRFITTNAVVLSVNIELPHLPVTGSAVRAKSATSIPGGGFTTLAVVAAQGVSSNLAAPLGTGPNSYTVRRELGSVGVNVLTDVLVGDIGVALVMVQEDGHTNTVLTPGVESEPTFGEMESVELHSGDMVLISGADLSSPAAGVLAEWGSSLPDDVTLVLAVSPAVEDVPYPIWVTLLERADIITMNIRESSALTRILEEGQPGAQIRDMTKPEAALVRRLGVLGCEVQTSEDATPILLPAYPVVRADNAGVGDTHVATMCASLLQGLGLVEACDRANAAAACMVSRKSALPVPTPDDIDRVIAAARR